MRDLKGIFRGFIVVTTFLGDTAPITVTSETLPWLAPTSQYYNVGLRILSITKCRRPERHVIALLVVRRSDRPGTALPVMVALSRRGVK